MQQLSRQLLIHELAEMANVSVRTIRYYIAEGLLPTPETRGKYTSYSQDYVERIRLIQRLKDAYLPLREIRALVENIPFEETHHLLNRTQNLSSEDFVKAIRERSQLDSPHRNINEDVVAYTSKLLRNPGQQSPAPSKRIDPGIDDDVILDNYRVQKEMIPPKLFQSDRSTGVNPNQPMILEENQYYRFSIIPGLEFHIDQVVYIKFRRQIDRLIEFAKSLFSNT